MPWGCFTQYMQLSLAGHLSLCWILIRVSYTFFFLLFNCCRIISPHLSIFIDTCSRSLFQLTINLYKSPSLFIKRVSHLHIFIWTVLFPVWSFLFFVITETRGADWLKCSIALGQAWDWALWYISKACFWRQTAGKDYTRCVLYLTC